MNKLTLKRLYNTGFKDLYWKLLSNPSEMTNTDLIKILELGSYFVTRDNADIQKLGYRLFLLYSKLTGDYKPLYEISINKGLIPISQFIYEQMEYSDQYDNLQTMINSIVNQEFKVNNLYKTAWQSKLDDSAKEFMDKSQIIVAPTSYGKTELILSFIDHFRENKNICIITPTKSLLAQTKKRILNHIGNQKIITQPEMYLESDRGSIAVLTQERLLRLLQIQPNLKFDVLIIDEAHNLLEKFSKDSARSVLLASTIVLCHKRNSDIIYKYLTPFLKSKDSISLKFIHDQTEWFTVDESVKSETFYFYDIENNVKEILDQFSTDRQKLISVQTENMTDDADVVIANADKKNIIYLNSPRKLEDFAKELAEKIGTINNDRISKAVRDLKEFVHEDYKLAEYIKKGVIYHHGSIPETIRYYIEELYSEVPELNMLVANSTLLEGVNIPATRMFILNAKKGRGYLTPSAFKNLIGRVCRFKEIFDPHEGTLDYLVPEIHIIKGNYCEDSFDALRFAKNTKILIQDENNIQDTIKNPLLKNNSEDDISKVSYAEEILENLSGNENITNSQTRKAHTLVGKLCFQNNVGIFDIFGWEDIISSELDAIRKASTLESVFTIMKILFFSKISDSDNSNENMRRLKQESAQKFYRMLIDWRINGFKTKDMINFVVNYWNSLDGEQAKYVYVGKWGDRTRGDNSYKKYWVDITAKSPAERVNLAIVRLKEEYDFIDNEIIKYVEVLNSLDLIEESLYLKIKYGTSDHEKIILLNCGMSNSLSNLLSENYSTLYSVDTNHMTVSFGEGLVDAMQHNNENGILISEVKLNLKETTHI